MKSFLTAAFCLVAILTFAQVHVRSYTRKDGTFVQAHERTKPDGILENNYSYPGNYNPNTNRTTPGTSSYPSRSSNSGSNQIQPSIPAYTPPPAIPPATIQMPTSDNDIFQDSWTSETKAAKPIKVYYPVTRRPLRTSSQPNIVSSSRLYVVSADIAFFYSLPNLANLKKAYLTKGEMFFGTKKSNGFVYVNFTNSLGQKTRGWINLFDLNL